MADMATLSALLQVVFDKMSVYAAEEHGLLWLLGMDLESLPFNLSNVKAVLSYTTRYEIKDPHLITLLKQLRDACYNADDVFDEFEYRVLRAQSKQGRSSCCSAIFCFDDRNEMREAQSKYAGKEFLRLIFKCYNDRRKLRECIAKLDCIAGSVSAILKMVQLDDGVVKRSEVMKRRETLSLNNRQIFGREQVTNMLVGRLMQEGKKLGVHAMVGPGGVGKTALAQLIFNHEAIKQVFDERMWISIRGDDFDVKMVIREMLEYFPNCKVSAYNNLDVIQSNLREQLVQKKFLLVFDGVWNMESEWTLLRNILESVGAEEGNMILVTTRNKQVSDTMGAADPIVLEGLSREEYWPLFEKFAFGDKKPEIIQDLEETGRRIADKLDGSPLAAITLGKLLSRNLGSDHWESISKCELWELVEQDEDDILPVLRLSYLQLPSHLKPCFVYCSLLPKGHKFDRKWLIQLWFAQGFILTEDEGIRYFGEFLSRCFFFKHNEGNDYSVHNLIYNLVRDVSKDIECFLVERDYKPELPQSTLHLSLCNIELHKAHIKDIRRLYKLRTLIFFDCRCSPDYESFDHDLKDLFTELKSIRVLSLSGSSLEQLPVNIDYLRHLRHLDLSNCTRITKFPASMKRLYNLQFLNVQGCNYASLPEEISKLISLRCLEKNAEIAHLSSQQPRAENVVIVEESNVSEPEGTSITQLPSPTVTLHSEQEEALNNMGILREVALVEMPTSY